MNNSILDNAKRSWLKIAVFILILGFYASFLVVKISPTYMDNDAGLYISDGKVIWETKSVFKSNIYSYVETDYPVLNHHWLSSVVFYLVSRFTGFAGLSVFKIAVLLAAFAILFWAATKKADFWLVAAAALPTILILSGRCRVRPEMFSYLFIALFFYLLMDLEKHPERKRIFWLIPLQVLWVNFHIYFFLGIFLAGGFLAEKINFNPLKFRGNAMAKRLLLVLVLLVAACFINPNGLDGALAPLKNHSYANFTVSENQPFFNLKASIFSWDIFGSAFMPMVFIFIISLWFGLKEKPRPVFYFLAGVGSAIVALFQIRLASLFALMFLPAVSHNFTGVFLRLKVYISRNRPGAVVALGYFLIFLVAAAFPYQAYTLNASAAQRGYQTDWGIGVDQYSNGAGNFFKENKLKGPIFNDYDIGGYILYHLYPAEKVFVDNNGADSYPESFFSDIFIPALALEDVWRATEEKYQLNAIFFSLRDGSPMVGNFLWARLHDPSWALVYADTYSIILVKNNAQNAEVIEKFQITPQNVEEKISQLLQSDNVSDKIMGGRVLSLIGREDLSTSILKKIVAKYPKNSAVWLYMGSFKVLQNDPASLISAAVFLENAVNMGEKTAEGYTWLGLAYFRTAQFDKAREAFQKALWLDPQRYDTVSYLNQLELFLLSSPGNI